MAQGTGSAVATFPASPQAGKPNVGSNTASIAVTGLTTFTDTDNASAWIMGSDFTASNNAYAHAFTPIECTITNPITGVGFTIELLSEWRLDGDFKVRYVWAT